MSQERWDVVLKVLTGPLAGLGEQVLRGPIVRVGLDPGPGGLRLSGYRGLDARHAVITAYDGGSVTIGPVGTNPVRVAPHAHVDWNAIDPIGGPVHLNAGGAIHLGPVGRGATMEFVRSQRLGVWTQGNLASEVGGATTIRTSRVPYWFLGCLFLMTVTTASVLLAVGAWWALQKQPQVLVTEEGEYWRDYATVDREALEEHGLLEGLEKPFEAFVMRYDAEASGRRKLADKANWDRKFYDHVAASVYQHAQYRKVFRRLEEVKDDYAAVVVAMRQAGLPEVFAGIPYRESTYRPDLQSPVCAKGWWQFMPEVAFRLQSQQGLDFVVRDCRFDGAPDVKWTPTDLAPPRNVRKNGIYVSATETCRITSCDVDDRTDRDKSTAAAVFTLKEAWDDADLRDSGALVQLVIASHNAGYDDSRFGVGKTSNVKAAYANWAKGVDEGDRHRFYGENITCAEGEEGSCGGALPAETQHYVYPIVARHLLAVCYYAKNHDDMAAFQPWTEHLDGYCSRFAIPTIEELKR